MSNNNYKRLHSGRFADAPFVTKEPLDITIGGLGGVGQYLVLALSRLRHNLYCYEDDTVEDINLESQLFKYNDLGKTKAECAKALIQDYSNLEITTLGRFDEDSFVSPYTFVPFDNMLARKLAFQKWESLPDRKIFIDLKCQAEELQVFAVYKEEHIEMYRKTLKDDSEIPDLPCTYKQTGHYASICANLGVAALCNYLSNEYYGEELRELPFKTIFTGAAWILSTN